MNRYLLPFGVITALSATSVLAAPVTNTSLQNINGNYGQGVATTTTDGAGTRTTVTGPGGGANRASGTTVVGQWYQANVGGGGTVGITTNHAQSGNGSAYFATTSGDSKADLQYYLPTSQTLSSLTSISYDFFRSSSSTAGAGLAPVMRIDIAKNGSFAGSLVYEFIYQNQTNPTPDTWTTLSGNLNNGIFWATNAALGPTFADANGGQKTLAAWIAGNAGSTLSVYGISIGVGSGFNGGTFDGAVDNVALNFAGGASVNSNFEVATVAAAAPEPATWAMMILGMGMAGGALRRRRKVATRVSFAA